MKLFDYKKMNVAIKVAEEKSNSYAHKMGCVIVDRKGNLLSKGWNNIAKTHPEQQRCAEKANLPNKKCIHAEMHAIIRLAKQSKIPYGMYIARVTPTKIGASKPCKVCMIAIKEAGIKKLFYYNTEDKLETMSL